ncbi:MurR/RpiR family transcriptional regulator [Promicromonospora sukumoe]|uniref:DNA-binding MurR/RpiR family transcriptional regulator n=2 Tax=Promicromonospora sukumoe TaxID=88382 RepID=A0A7W3JBI9_9MICO|nr:MurR/RpiR family transcriptional regulator [Promicromonospora sukumoe]MBA8809785.1 DNA-binding MurR/RpiR family transcriptional regulator [Promicromonospora sukumoe]
MTGDVLVRLRRALPTLRPAEARVAQTVLDDPNTVVQSTITELAGHADTSQATVVRFCRAVGYAGYPEFRIDLAQATSRREVEMERSGIAEGEINQTDDIEAVVSKIAFHEARTIEETARMIDTDAIERVATAISEAKRVDVYGVGSSNLAAADLAMKLQRIGVFVFSSPDPHQQLASSALLEPGNVAVAVSHSGQTRETNQALEIARKRGALTAAITNFPDAPIGLVSDVVLATTARETQFRVGAMSSRIAQLTVVDYLFVRVAQRTYDRSSIAIKATYDAVRDQRLDFGSTKVERPAAPAAPVS